MNRSTRLALVPFTAALMASQANAAAVDVTAVATDISAQLVPIGTLGAAVLLVFVAIKAFKWVRRAMS